MENQKNIISDVKKNYTSSKSVNYSNVDSRSYSNIDTRSYTTIRNNDKTVKIITSGNEPEENLEIVQKTKTKDNSVLFFGISVLGLILIVVVILIVIKDRKKDYVSE